MQIWRLVTVVAVLVAAHSASGATVRGELVRFRPITQSEYETIMDITDGRPVISEGRLTLGGLAGLAAGLTTGWATSLIPSFLTSFSGLRTNVQKGAGNYPLCVIRTEDEVEHHVGGKSVHRRQTKNRSDQQHNGGHNHHHNSDYDNHHSHQHYGHDHNHDHSAEGDNNDDDGVDDVPKKKLAPIVNCIVVVKDEEDEDNDDHDDDDDDVDDDNESPWHPTKRPTNSTKRPHHTRPPHFPHRPPGAGQAGGDAYFNPWYWYNPYFQYAYGFPGVYPGGYPASYSVGNPASTQEDATTPESFQDLNLPQATAEDNQLDEADAARKPATRPKRVRSRPMSSRANPVYVNNADHSRGQRNEISSHPYARISSYADSGYQPSLYPQFSYQSNYPKVSYTQALPYPAPVYVTSTTQRPRTVRPKLPQIPEFDSEELDNSAEYIQVRSNDHN